MPAPQIEQSKRSRIVISGGGAKGADLPGVYRAMWDAGLLDEIEMIAGSSVGAITGAFMAVGILPEDFSKGYGELKFQTLLGDSAYTLGGSPRGVSPWTKTGKLLEEFTRQTIIDSTKKTLLRIVEGGLPITDECQAIFKKILEADAPCITFGDLAKLHKDYPAYFKDLTVTATKQSDGELFVFNGTTTSDVEVAQACRASASLPIKLAPFSIDINGKKITFVDSGMTQNLPTDYFDMDEEDGFKKNQKPEETLVFAFGEGHDNKKNAVFKALYGHQLDTLGCIDEIRQEVSNALADRTKTIPQLVREKARTVLQEKVKTGTIARAQAELIFETINRQVNSYMKHHPDSFVVDKPLSEQETNLRKIFSKVTNKLKPTLYHPKLSDRIIRDHLINLFNVVKTKHKYTKTKEMGYHKIRSEYLLNTVELRTGTLTTTDFKRATRISRVINALGYLDTMNYITNHDLQNKTKFDANQFYISLVDNFTKIYTGVLVGAGKNPEKSNLLKEIELTRRTVEASFNKYALSLMSISEDCKLDDPKFLKELDDRVTQDEATHAMPILIKHGKQFYLYGNSGGNEWKLTPLAKWPFVNLDFPKPNEKPHYLYQSKITPGMYNAIKTAKAHNQSNTISDIDKQARIAQAICHVIKDHVEKNPTSAEAFALSRALELKQKTLTPENLYKETYAEGFKRSGFFARSKATGTKIFSSQHLNKELKTTSLKDLTKTKNPHSRSSQVFASLSPLLGNDSGPPPIRIK